MRTKEVMAAALVGLGELRVEPDGSIWRGNRRADTGRARGYLRVQFTVDGTRYSMGAHRLVWMVANHQFIPEGMEVNHKNGNKADNRPENLEIVLHDFNAAHALHSLGKLQMRHTPGAKLTHEQVLEIREMVRAGVLSKAEIARRYGVTTKTIRNIETGAKWRALFAK